MNQHYNRVERFYSLDVLRGIAALSVVFWHWQHFFFDGTDRGTFDVSRLPLSEYLFVLYTKGWLAVDLFFSLSGFIFYWLYSKHVSEGAISPSRFALLRFSRLYPLHFATLIFVAVGQLWWRSQGGIYFVYPKNDTTHFILNLFFASSWGIEGGSSFNGPAWSVSVEVMLYALFFTCCRLLPVRMVVLAVISVIGFILERKYAPMGRGIGSFFLGGCVFLAYQAIIASRHALATTKWAMYLVVGAWAATFFFSLPGVDFTPRYVPFLLRLEPSVQWGIEKLLIRWPALVLFPITILSLALTETLRGPFGKCVSFLGDISYSSYLLHFPLQFLFSVLVARLALGRSIYYSPWFMGLFFAVLILVSLGSYRYFEVSAQRLLRKSGLTRRSTERTEVRR